MTFIVLNQWGFMLTRPYWYLSHPVLRRRGYVVTTSLRVSQRRRRYVPNETPNDVSKERCQDISVVRLHDALLERRNDVSKGRNNDVPSVRLHDVSNKSQWNTQQRPSGTLPRRFSDTYPRRPISTSLRRLLYLPNKTSKKVVVARLHHVSELPFRDVLLVSLYCTLKLLCHNLHLVGFYVSFKYQIKHQIFLRPTRRETKRGFWIINYSNFYCI